jgi:hypothetical protein
MITVKSSSGCLLTLRLKIFRNFMVIFYLNCETDANKKVRGYKAVL